MLKVYRVPGESEDGLLEKIRAKTGLQRVTSIRTEFCFCVEVEGSADALSEGEVSKLQWLFAETYEPKNTSREGSFLVKMAEELPQGTSGRIIEVGPRLAFSTAWSSNCVSICEACGVPSVRRIERVRRYLITTNDVDEPLSAKDVHAIASVLHDRMTECVYTSSLESFESGTLPAETRVVPILEEGASALRQINMERGLGFDDWDINFYTRMFTDTLCRNPTDVECFDLGQSNSEHSRHWFFSGVMVLDGVEQKETLFSMVKATCPKGAESNSIIAFHDNSSALRGFEVDTLVPSSSASASAMQVKTLTLHPILTAETHNFPTGVAPFAGAETGTGGRLRDVQATGRGAHTLAGVSAYCVGNLNIPNHAFAWEVPETPYASNLALPLDIEIQASNGASDYGNKYGEPVVAGFTRSFGQRLPNGERVEWIKPIMFTAGIGMLDSRHTTKGEPEVGMVVCKIGGPAYRIGMGGGAASSRVQSEGDTEEVTSQLDFDAVQRGDAEMENRMNRVIRACVEMGEDNPIVSIHDQGAGGNGNVLKELVDPLGATYQLRSIPTGDKTLSTLEIWGAEYQENNAFLVRSDRLEEVLAISKRENCPVSPVGIVSGSGNVEVIDSLDGSVPFNLPLSLVLGKMPQKTFHLDTPPCVLKDLELPVDLTVSTALDRVLRLLDVGSKRFLTNKVDRSVSGLVAQQQCVGPLHIPLSNVAVLAQSHLGTTGAAVAVGEQPIKGLISPEAQARMTVGEALTNLVWAKITSLSDVKASGNWMWAAKLPGEGAKMWAACAALRDCLLAIGPGIDGGKDSLSMSAKVGTETVKSPGQVTLTVYAACPDITLTVTPDIKRPGHSTLLFVDLAAGRRRLGGTALSTVFGQLGNESPDLEDPALFVRAFNCVQELLSSRLILAGHDRSDGGLIVCALEMAFAGNCGFEILLEPASAPIQDITELFNEELGLVLEILNENVEQVRAAFVAHQVPCNILGRTSISKQIVIRRASSEASIIDAEMCALRDVWESTSFALERLQTNHSCVTQEQANLSRRTGPSYVLTYTPSPSRVFPSRPRVAVIRQEGSNGDREMLAAFHIAGFEAWDVNMRDLLLSSEQLGAISLDGFRGIAWVGGFSYADVNDSAKGWAGAIRFNEKLLCQFENFRTRADTFSLGVCNGCQLMALLGWVPFPAASAITSESAVGLKPQQTSSSSLEESEQPRFVHNASGRFESRWSAVKVEASPSIFLKDMQGSTLGVWVAHGEGRVLFPNASHLALVEEKGLAPLRYVDDDNQTTEAYPFNPNGSPHGIAALCSSDGRHLALMPHPERCVQTWQCPYLPPDQRDTLQQGPWLKLFQNARDFCEE